MIYFSCLSCPPHSTLDHGDNGKGACLFPDCLCKKFAPGAEFVKARYVRLSHDDAIKVATERGVAS